MDLIHLGPETRTEKGLEEATRNLSVMWDEKSTSIGTRVHFLAPSFMVYSSFNAFVSFPLSDVVLLLLAR